MVLHKHGERLYVGLKQVVTEHLENEVRTFLVCTFARRYHLDLVVLLYVSSLFSILQ